MRPRRSGAAPWQLGTINLLGCLQMLDRLLSARTPCRPRLALAAHTLTDPRARKRLPAQQAFPDLRIGRALCLNVGVQCGASSYDRSCLRTQSATRSTHWRYWSLDGCSENTLPSRPDLYMGAGASTNKVGSYTDRELVKTPFTAISDTTAACALSLIAS
jgi:hypothetical protein